MADAGSIRAGKASVEVSADTGPLAAGLARAGAALKRFATSDFGIVTFAAAGAATAIGAAALAFAERGTHLLHQAEQVGASVEFMSGMSKGLEFLGGSADSATQSMFRFNNKLAAAIGGSAEAHQAFQRLGINAASLNNMTTDERMDKISEAFQGLSSHAEKSRAAMALFGRGGREMVEALSRPGGLKGLREEMQKLGFVMSGEQAEKALELHQSFMLLKNSGLSLLTAFIEPLVPAIRGIANALGVAARSVRDWGKENLKWLEDLGKAFAAGEFTLGWDIAMLNMRIAWLDFKRAILDSIPQLKGAMATIGSSWESVAKPIQRTWIAFAARLAGSSPQRIQQLLNDMDKHERPPESDADERARLMAQLNALKARLANRAGRGGPAPDLIEGHSFGTRGTFDASIAPQLATGDSPVVQAIQRNFDEITRERIAVEQARDILNDIRAALGNATLVFN